MSRSFSYAVVIPARGGSKGIPRKNLREVGGRPLVSWSIRQALAVEDRAIRVVVSTDDEEIRVVALREGAEVPDLRPADLATHEASTESVLEHTLAELRATGTSPTALILLQPTSPVRHVAAVRDAIGVFEDSGADSVVSVAEIHPFIWRNKRDARPSYDPLRRPMRQQIADDDRLYLENGSIYITTVDAFARSGCRCSGRTVLFVMSHLESIDIDTEEDLRLADAILREEVAR